MREKIICNLLTFTGLFLVKIVAISSVANFSSCNLLANVLKKERIVELKNGNFPVDILHYFSRLQCEYLYFVQ